MTQPITPETVTRIVLNNGITVLVKENHSNASVSLHGNLRAGGMYDSESTSGLAQFTSASLQRGTDRFSFHRLNEISDRLGMFFGVSANIEIAEFAGRSLSEDFDQLLTIAEQVLLHPTFPAREIEKLRGQILAGLQEANEDTYWVAYKNFCTLCYPLTHPFHRLSEGTEESIKQVKRKQILGFHTTFYRPEGTTLVIVGNVNTKQIIEGIRKRLERWKVDGAVPPFEIPPAPERNISAQKSLSIPGKSQSDVIIGYPGIARRDPDYYALMTSDLILGRLGLFGRLGEVVRERMGLAYYIHSSLNASIGAGPWMINAGVNPKNVNRAVEAIFSELQHFYTAGITQEELEHAQDYLTGSLALRLESNGGVAATLASIELNGLGLDYIERFPATIRALTVDQVNATVKKHMQIETAITVVAGP